MNNDSGNDFLPPPTHAELNTWPARTPSPTRTGKRLAKRKVGSMPVTYPVKANSQTYDVPKTCAVAICLEC